MSSKKILVLSIPRLEPHRPPISACLVATVCKNQGHDVVLRDLNIEFFHYCKKEKINYYSFNGVFDRYRNATDIEVEHLTNFINSFCKSEDLNSYDFVLISVFGVSTHYFGGLLLSKISPNRKFKICVGGNGAFVSLTGISLQSFAEYYQTRKLIDDYIKGECEESLKLYLSGQTGPGINNLNDAQIKDLNSLPFPDYSFIDLNDYDYILGEKDIYIESSRGCVRDCSYCDVAAYWPKYRYRSGKIMAEEIIKNYEVFGIKRFYFTDSLVNGNLKTFSQMCEVLANYNFTESIKWGGQFIFRDSKSVKPDHFKMIAEAGGDVFYVGVETGSDKIRKEMGKNFTNEDIEYQLDQFDKNKLKCTFLMFPGYVTETYDDHLETVAMFKRWQKYVASGTINSIELGFPLIILEKTPLAKQIKDMQISFLSHSTLATNHLWRSDLNLNLDFVERVRRQVELYEEAVKYKWPIWRFESRAEELKEALREFYKIKSKGSKYKVIDIKVRNHD
jgi:hypothetical protein